MLNVASKSILTPTIEEQRVTRIAWATGAGKGIGRQVSLELAKEGLYCQRFNFVIFDCLIT